MSVGYFAHGFDLVNVGDLDLVRQALELCTTLVVGVLTDEQMLELQGRSPVVPLSERLALVEHVRGIDSVVTHEWESAVAAQADVRFVSADLQTALPGPDVVALVPRRTTQSALMLAALRPVDDDAVAS